MLPKCAVAWWTVVLSSVLCTIPVTLVYLTCKLSLSVQDIFTMCLWVGHPFGRCWGGKGAKLECNKYMVGPWKTFAAVKLRWMESCSLAYLYGCCCYRICKWKSGKEVTIVLKWHTCKGSEKANISNLVFIISRSLCSKTGLAGTLFYHRVKLASLGFKLIILHEEFSSGLHEEFFSGLFHHNT